MAAKIYREPDVDPSLIKSRRVGVVGYGNQGRAHALNLRDSGVSVEVGLHEGSRSRERAREDGFAVLPVAELAPRADLLMLLTPDVPMRNVYREEIAPYLRPGQAIAFAHGFNVRYGLIEPPPEIDVLLVSPKGPGRQLRGEYEAGRGLAALVGVHQDATGQAWPLALSYAGALGCARRGILETTFAEETECDLFGEQAVLCGGLVELVKAGFDTLVEAGYSPEAAYYECFHEVKLITDLMFESGIAGMRRAISDTAEWGGFVSGPRVVGDEARQAMREVLERIQSGEFAREWIAESDAGSPNLNRYREEEAAHPIDKVRQRLKPDGEPG
jgi:ketol-acid reductoisomerase